LAESVGKEPVEELDETTCESSVARAAVRAGVQPSLSNAIRAM
jgi:hypothetical protein